MRFLIVMQGMRLAAAGVAVGVPPALALTRIMVSMVFGIATRDPLVLGIVSVLPGGGAWCATYVPTVRTTRIDPLDALRG